MSLSSRAHDLLKSVDAVLGRRLARHLRRPPAPLPSDPRDVLVVRLWGLGNLTLVAPHLEACSDRRVRLLTLKRNAAFVTDQFPEVELLVVPDPLDPRFVGACAGVVRALRRDPPQVVVDLEQFLRLPLVLVRHACRAPIVGLDTPGQGRSVLLDHPLAHDGLRHVAETFAALWGAAGLPRGTGPGPLRVDPAVRRRLAEELVGTGPLVVLHPGSGDHFPGRRWPPERFGALAEALARTCDARLVVTGSRPEARLCRRVVEACNSQLIDLTARLSTSALVALLDLADLVVTNDTGPLHMADAVGTRCVALYGPNTPHRYGPRQPGSRALFADLPCSPCLDDRTMKRSACRHFACMDALSVQAVLGACTGILGRWPTHGSPAPREERARAVGR